MASWSGIPERKEFYQTSGPLRFWSALGIVHDLLLRKSGKF